MYLINCKLGGGVLNGPIEVLTAAAVEAFVGGLARYHVTFGPYFHGEGTCFGP